MRILAASVEAAGLCLLQLVLLTSFTNALDLHAWDEVLYYRQGLALLAGDWSQVSYAWSLPASALYALLELVLPALVVRADAMLVLCACASTLALWWALRALLPSPAALVCAAWWAASPKALGFEYPVANTSVYLCGMALCCLAFGFAARRRVLFSVLFLVVAALNRGECALVVPLVGVLLVLLGQRRAGVLAACVGVLVLAFYSVLPQTRARSWFAFSQHYALNLQERNSRMGDLSRDQEAFAFPEPHVAKAFGESDSILEAARENPSELLRHVWHNATLLPREFAAAFCAPFGYAPALRYACLLLAIVAAGLALARRRTALVGLWTQTPVEARCLLLASCAVLPVVLLVRARSELLLPLSLPFFALLGAIVALAQRRSPSPGTARGVVARWLPSAGITLLAALAPRPYTALASEHLVSRFTLGMLRGVPEPKRLLGVSAPELALLAYRSPSAAVDFTKLAREAGSTGASFGELLQRVQPDAVLVTPALLSYEGQHPGILAELGGEAWELAAVHPVVSLFRRKR